jgi:hypothetical protein
VQCSVIPVLGHTKPGLLAGEKGTLERADWCLSRECAGIVSAYLYSIWKMMTISMDPPAHCRIRQDSDLHLSLELRESAAALIDIGASVREDLVTSACQRRY